MAAVDQARCGIDVCLGASLVVRCVAKRMAKTLAIETIKGDAFCLVLFPRSGVPEGFVRECRNRYEDINHPKRLRIVLKILFSKSIDSTETFHCSVTGTYRNFPVVPENTACVLSLYLSLLKLSSGDSYCHRGKAQAR